MSSDGGILLGSVASLRRVFEEASDDGCTMAIMIRPIDDGWQVAIYEVDPDNHYLPMGTIPYCSAVNKSLGRAFADCYFEYIRVESERGT